MHRTTKTMKKNLYWPF